MYYPTNCSASPSHAIEPLINERDLAALLGVGISTLARWRSAGTGPHFVVLGPRRLAYRANDIHIWLAQQARSSGTVIAGTITMPEDVAWRPDVGTVR